MCYSESHHGSVGEGERPLHETLAVGSAAHDHTAVPVLDGACGDFGRRGGILVHHHHEASLIEKRLEAGGGGEVVVAWRVASFGIYREASRGEELAENLYRGLKVASAVVDKVEDKAVHALLFQVAEGFCDFMGRFCGISAQTDISCFRIDHVGGIDAVDGYVGAGDAEVDSIGFSGCSAEHADIDFCSLGPAKAFHNICVTHFYAGNESVVNADYPVASEKTDTFRGTSGHGGDNIKRVAVHIEGDADTAEITGQRLVELFGFLRIGICGMRVELFEHTADGRFHELVFIHRVDIELGHGSLGHTQFLVGRNSGVSCCSESCEQNAASY